MPAFVAVKVRLRRLPSGIPDTVPILDINVLAVSVQRHVIVPVAGDPQELCVLIKGITAACIGDQGEKVRVSQIVDPGEGSLGSSDHILSAAVIEITEFHCFLRFRF